MITIELNTESTHELGTVPSPATVADAGFFLLE